MHKDFYASGFLYHSRTQRILLQKEKQTDPNSSVWSLFYAKAEKDETDKDCFRRLIKSLFKIELDIKSIFSVYDYFHDDLKKNNFISYAKVKKLEDFNGKNAEYKWFDFKETLKLKLAPQTKQDIMVMQRVINSSIRKTKGERYID